jgi:hypothetical protein
MSELCSAIDGMAAVDVAGLPDAALEDELAGLRLAVNRLEAQFERRLAVFDARGIAEQQGRISSASWVTGRFRLDPAEASWRVRLSRRLDDMPTARAAFEAGEIGLEHARVVGTAVAEMKPEKKSWAEQVLTTAAASVEPIALDRLSRQLRYELDPDTADERAKKQHDGRRLSCASTFGGMVSINGLLEPVAGSMVQNAFNAFMRPQPNDERTAPQRRADALEEICQRVLRTDQAPASGGARPQMLVRVGFDRLDKQPGAHPADVSMYGPIGDIDLRRLACDSELTRIIFGPNGEPLDVGRSQRSFPIAIRRALLAQWTTCFWPGCTAPAQWSEGHHLDHWLDGGETSVENAALPCAYHHHVIHRDGWELEKLPDGTIIARHGPKTMICKPNAP